MANKRTSLDEFPTNFKITLAERVRAASGLPAHLRRKRRIEDLEEATVQALAQLLDEAEMEFGTGSAEAVSAFRERASELDLRLLNDLIERHNRYYPVEANLPTDVKTGKLMMGTTPWEPMQEATVALFVERILLARQ
jgi:hypothetical protein